jgi:hypothetical protein
MLDQLVISAVPTWIKALISRVKALEEGFARLDERLKGTNDLLRLIHNDLRK